MFCVVGVRLTSDKESEKSFLWNIGWFATQNMYSRSRAEVWYVACAHALSGKLGKVADTSSNLARILSPRYASLVQGY